PTPWRTSACSYWTTSITARLRCRPARTTLSTLCRPLSTLARQWSTRATSTNISRRWTRRRRRSRRQQVRDPPFEFFARCDFHLDIRLGAGNRPDRPEDQLRQRPVAH